MFQAKTSHKMLLINMLLKTSLQVMTWIFCVAVWGDIQTGVVGYSQPV